MATSAPATSTPVKAGFVINRAVGGAVERNRVRRRLQHLVQQRLPALPDGALLVVRAQPAARGASSQTLGHDLDRALARLGVAAADRG